MGVYTRFKRQPGGLRALVELLETTPASRRGKMIEVGMAEDPSYTKRALEYVMTFEDVLGLPDVELAEVLAATPPRMTALSIHSLSEEIQGRFLKNALPQLSARVKDFLAMNATLREIGGAQLKMVEIARQLERKGLVRIKRIPE